MEDGRPRPSSWANPAMVDIVVNLHLACDFFSTLSSCGGQLVAEFFGLGG
jgi:hypothetical protein